MGQKFSTATGAHKINFCCASPLSLLVLAGVIICTAMTRNLAAQIIDDSIAGIGACRNFARKTMSIALLFVSPSHQASLLALAPRLNKPSQIYKTR
jgi:hypothetical protein